MVWTTTATIPRTKSTRLTAWITIDVMEMDTEVPFIPLNAGVNQGQLWYAECYRGRRLYGQYDAAVCASILDRQTFDVDRGDGSFDYDCSGTEEKMDEDLAECSWRRFTCDVDVTGWVGSVPSSCGISGSMSMTMTTVRTH